MSQPPPDTAVPGPAEVEQLRRRLRALEAGRRALLEAVPGAAVEVDAAGRVVACNWRFAALCGATEGELAGRQLSALGLNGSVRLERRPLPPPAEGELVVAEPLPPHPPGERGAAEGSPRAGEGGRGGATPPLQQVVQDMPFLIVAHDEHGRMAAWNRECERVTGYSAVEVLGNPRAWELLLPDAAHRERMLREWRERGDFRDWEWRLTARDGSERVVAWSSRSGRCPVPGWRRWAVGVDVTDRKRAEDERRTLDGKAQEARRLESLSVLAGGVAHDFNNLLTGIIGFASLARQEAAGAAGRGHLDRVLQSAQRAAELCGQMLAYSGRGRFVVGPLDLSGAVRDLSAQFPTSAPKAALALELADGLPPVLADAAQVRQVVLNLVQNASEALGERGGAVAVRTGRAWCDRASLRGACLEDDFREGEYVFIEIADSGSGMDAETRRRAFEPFFTTKFMGRGLGLAAVLGVVRGHRGAIELTSELGLGTTVRVWFPRAPEAAPAPAPAAVGAGGAVLFVDDEPALRDLAVRTLRPAGYEALTAADGLEALEVLRARGADVRAVVLDLTMPGLDADETLRQLRRVCPDVPVILSSGYGEQDAARRFAAGDLAGFLQKPYRPHQLIELIRRVADRQGDKETRREDVE